MAGFHFVHKYLIINRHEEDVSRSKRYRCNYWMLLVICLGELQDERNKFIGNQWKCVQVVHLFIQTRIHDRCHKCLIGSRSSRLAELCNQTAVPISKESKDVAIPVKVYLNLSIFKSSGNNNGRVYCSSQMDLFGNHNI